MHYHLGRLFPEINGAADKLNLCLGVNPHFSQAPAEILPATPAQQLKCATIF